MQITLTLSDVTTSLLVDQAIERGISTEHYANTLLSEATLTVSRVADQQPDPAFNLKVSEPSVAPSITINDIRSTPSTK